MDGRSRIATKRIGNDFGDSTAATKYNLENHLGTSTTRLDDTGNLIDREEFYPFGDSSLRTFEKKRYRYVGKEKDSESGLYYYGARYYSAWTCRFISIDPLADQYAQLNSYNYAANDPIGDVDIDGMQSTGAPNTETNSTEDRDSQSSEINQLPVNPVEGQIHSFTYEKGSISKVQYEYVSNGRNSDGERSGGWNFQEFDKEGKKGKSNDFPGDGTLIAAKFQPGVLEQRETIPTPTLSTDILDSPPTSKDSGPTLSQGKGIKYNHEPESKIDGIIDSTKKVVTQGNDNDQRFAAATSETRSIAGTVADIAKAAAEGRAQEIGKVTEYDDKKTKAKKVEAAYGRNKGLKIIKDIADRIGKFFDGLDILLHVEDVLTKFMNTGKVWVGDIAKFFVQLIDATARATFFGAVTVVAITLLEVGGILDEIYQELDRQYEPFYLK